MLVRVSQANEDHVDEAHAVPQAPYTRDEIQECLVRCALSRLLHDEASELALADRVGINRPPALADKAGCYTSSTPRLGDLQQPCLLALT